MVDDVRAALAAVADPAKAAPMQAYMKSTMPNLGVQKPARVAALRSVLRDHPLPDRRTWEDTVRLLWDEATYREERYAATDLARHRTYVEWATHPGSLELFDHMIVSGAWWDHVDEMSIRLVGPLLRAHPEQVVAAVRRWSRDPDRWRRRAAVIAQIGSRDATDTALLAECILANVDDADFFLRKGIGWALREHAKTDPDWVRRVHHVVPEPTVPAVAARSNPHPRALLNDQRRRVQLISRPGRSRALRLHRQRGRYEKVDHGRVHSGAARLCRRQRCQWCSSGFVGCSGGCADRASDGGRRRCRENE